MENNTQLELQKLSKDSKGIKGSVNAKDSVQFNIAISKTSKKKFMAFCLENELVVKEAAENALLEFMEKRK